MFLRFHITCHYFTILIIPVQHNTSKKSLGIHWKIPDIIHLLFVLKTLQPEKFFSLFQSFMKKC